MPARIDMIVPKMFCRGAPIPRALNLHYADLRQEETEQISYVSVTTALRTLLDLWRSGGTPQEMLLSAFQEAKDQGRITNRQIHVAMKDPEWEEAVASLSRKG